MNHHASGHLPECSTPYVSRSSVLGSFLAVLLTLSLGGCGSGGEGDQAQANPDPNPGGSTPVQPVTAQGYGVTANQNFAGGDFVDVEKYNKAIENYNTVGSALAGEAP